MIRPFGYSDTPNSKPLFNFLLFNLAGSKKNPLYKTIDTDDWIQTVNNTSVGSDCSANSIIATAHLKLYKGLSLHQSCVIKFSKTEDMSDNLYYRKKANYLLLFVSQILLSFRHDCVWLCEREVGWMCGFLHLGEIEVKNSVVC